MSFSRSAFLVLTLASATAFAQLPSVEPVRNWKTADGQPFQASLLNFDGTTAFFKMQNGRPAQSPAEKLSAEDRQYLAEWQKRQPIKFVMPDVVGVDTAQLKAEVVSEDTAAEKFVYRTDHFELESQGKFKVSLLREVARDFEATYELLKALPWHIEPKPPSGNYFHARLFKDRAAYMAAGGVPNSGGIYMSKTETFLVPFESIGVKLAGSSFMKSDAFDSSTMVHELTHQMMHFWLDLLPLWVAEGTAEYTANLPLHAGHFNVSKAKTGLRDYVDNWKKRGTGALPEPYPLEKLFDISSEQWMETMMRDPAASQRMYYTSYLLVYYFMHLDGKGDSQRFLHYFRELESERKDAETYRNAMTEFFKKPGVTLKPDGSYTYRSDIPHPPKPAFMASPAAQAEFQKKTLAILLDGRSEDELMKQIRSAYRGLGIKL